MDKRILIAMTFVLSLVGTASATTWSVDGSGGADFTGIQDAINNASAGDTINVYSSVYYENVVVNKSVTLKGIGQPVVDASGEGDAITLTADGITLEWFNVTNAGSSFRDAGLVVTSNDNIIAGNNVSNNSGYGICLGSAGYKCRDGICLGDPSNNRITGNNVCNNSGSGISVYSSSSNKIYFNNFINNIDNVDSYESANIWNSPLEITYTYDGNAYTNYLGNYWDDYEVTDADGDGIGNTTYSIDSEKDESDDYPLMKPLENYTT